jgi:hypothetical protein
MKPLQVLHADHESTNGNSCPEARKRTLFVELAGSSSEVRRDPIRIGDFVNHVFAGRSVLLMDFRKALTSKSSGDAHEGRPQALMHIRNFAVNKTTDQYIRAVPDGAGQYKYFLTPRMSPPAAANRTARDRFGERRHRATR